MYESINNKYIYLSMYQWQTEIKKKSNDNF